ncbi:MAG: hypothetical protein ACOC8P_02130 [Dichotomicrobium sp.]
MPAKRATAGLLTAATAEQPACLENACGVESGALGALRDKADAIVALIERNEAGEIDGADAMTILRDLMPRVLDKAD